VVGGPNGAGKSTIVRRFNRFGLPVVNPDDIARAIDADRVNDRAVQLGAGRLALEERARRLSARESFVVETTLSGHSEMALMRQAAGLGYKVNFVFVGLAWAEISRNRVALRVSRGGHDVPDEDVERRFERILANLPRALDTAERSFVLDNSGRQPRLLLAAETGRPARVAGRLPDWLRTVLAGSKLGDEMAN
jgi:predicted ABC-type ATPase